jgi:hypothetical protein
MPSPFIETRQVSVITPAAQALEATRHIRYIVLIFPKLRSNKCSSPIPSGRLRQWP